MRIKRFCFSLPLFIAALLFTGIETARCDDIDWQSCPPEEKGMDSRELALVLERAQELDLDLHSLILIRNGRVILECYPHPYDENSLHNVKSVSKSIMSAMVGIALREGILKSLDEKVYDYFPQYFTDETDSLKKTITLRHLLTMTSGLDLDENGPIAKSIFSSDDWIGATLARPMIDNPGDSFLYCSGLTHVMSGILTEAAGRGLLDLCNEYLFDALGITGAQWRKGPKGYYFGGAELFLKPRDLARIGVLYLNDGRWNGRQIVPEEWVKESTSGQVGTGCAGQQYGYWWYTDDKGFVDAIGWGGQGIRFHRGTGTVMVVTAATHNAGDILFRDFDWSTIGDGPKPPDPEAYGKLLRMVGELENPTLQKPPDSPEIAGEIFGKRYEVDPNPMYEAITFDFPEDDTAVMKLEASTAEYRLSIGLDGRYRVNDVGEFGRMPGGNRLATRGEWLEDGTFVLDFHEMGSPAHWEILVTFEDDRVELSITDRPLYRKFALSGRTR